MSEDEGSSEEEDEEVISDQEDADVVSEAAGAAPSDTEEEGDGAPAAAALAQPGSTAAGTEIGDEKGATPVGGEEGEAEGNSDPEVRVALPKQCTRTLLFFRARYVCANRCCYGLLSPDRRAARILLLRTNCRSSSHAK